MKMKSFDNKLYEYRKLDGNRPFKLWNLYESKEKAKDVAKNLRSSNTQVRIIKIKTKWVVYIRDKHPKKKIVFY